MAYTRPDKAAANASWSGAQAYTLPDYQAADGDFSLYADPYLRPLKTAADATWQGADPYTRPDYLAADATWQATTPSTVVNATLAVSLPVEDPPLTLTGTARVPLPGEYLPIPIDAANATWQGADPYIRPPFDGGVTSFAPPADRVLAVGLVALPPPADPELSAAGFTLSIYYASSTIALPPPADPELTPAIAATRVAAASAAIALPPPEEPPLTPVIAASQDIDLPTDTGPVIANRSQEAIEVSNGLSAKQSSAEKTATPGHHKHATMEKLSSPLSGSFTEMIRFREARLEPRHEHGKKLERQFSQHYAEMIRFRRNRIDPAHQHGRKIDGHATPIHAESIRIRRNLEQGHQEGAPIEKRLDNRSDNAIRVQTRHLQQWQQGDDPAPGEWWPFWFHQCTTFMWSATYTPQDYRAAVASFAYSTDYTRPPAICRGGWRNYPPAPPPEPPAEIDLPILIPALRVYYMINDIQITRHADGFLIDAKQLQIELNADSHTWTCSATLVGKETIDAIAPAPDGTPTILSVHINGNDWLMVVDSWEESGAFAQRTINMKARGLTAELSSSHVTPESGTTTADLTLQQLLNNHLPLGSGWQITWKIGTPDWIVPAGAWSWQNKAPIDAIHEVCASVGLIAVPDPATRTIQVMPRYPVMPWKFDSTPFNLLLPANAITGYSKQQPPPTRANGIYAHGSEIGGVIGYVTLDGTAGDKLDAAAQSPLVTHVDAARLLGGRRLAAKYQQPHWRSLTTPLGGSVPLAKLGQLLHIDAGTDSSRGIIAGINISATIDNTAKVRQTIRIGEDSGNQWLKFKNLSPGEPTLIGTVADSDATTNTSTLILFGGDQIKARGTGTIGEKVYVKGGVIEGTAPNLPVHAITV